MAIVKINNHNRDYDKALLDEKKEEMMNKKTDVIETNCVQHNIEVGVEFALHRAILSLKTIHDFDSITVQMLVDLIRQLLGSRLSVQDDFDYIDEEYFANEYIDRLLDQENMFIEIYGQENFDFIVNAILYFGGLYPEEIA